MIAIVLKGSHAASHSSPETERRLIQLMADMHGAPTRDTSPAAIRAALGRLREANLVWCGDGPHVLEESLSAAWLKELGPHAPASGYPASRPSALPATPQEPQAALFRPAVGFDILKKSST